MSKTLLNLQVLKKTRRKPESGDIFTFQVSAIPDKYFFGRVITTDSKLGYIDSGVILIYIYNVTSNDKTFIPELLTEHLLLPPIGTNQVPWFRGYFELVATSKISKLDVLQQHCFYSPIKDEYLDEQGLPVRTIVEPVGLYGLSGLEYIDAKIADALNLKDKRLLVITDLKHI